MQNVLQYNGKFYVCGTGRQTLVRSKTSNDNYYLLTMAAIAQEIREYSCAVTPQVRQTGNRLSGLAGTAYASLLT